RADMRAEMLAQELGVAGPGLVRDVAICPITKPTLCELAYRLAAGIDVFADKCSGNDLGGLYLRLRAGAGQRDGFCGPSAGDGIAAGVEFQTPRRSAAPREASSHYSPPSLGLGRLMISDQTRPFRLSTVSACCCGSLLTN